ncbi:MAG: hypothetical protein M1453_07755 [Acidobacteria bacterium]|nr:hypothetical protein [Acidobacteriota bacterium]
MHATLVIWALYLLGQILHVLKRAGMAVRSKSNSIRSRWEFVVFFWDALLVRVLLCAGLFAALLADPSGLTKLLASLGSGVTADITVNPGTALIFGYFADSVLDWLVSKIPMLQKELPAWNGPRHPAP